MIEIIPAIDIMDGRCVRLCKGDYGQVTRYDNDPVDQSLMFRDAGARRLHLVDLDGARSASPVNLRTLERVANACGLDIEWGGGIKSAQALKDSFDAGASRAICGSIAVRQPEVFASWLESFGPSKVILGADAKDGRIAVQGWTEESELTVEQIVERFLPQGLRQVICTDIAKDGMLQGPSFDLYTRLQAKFPSVDFTVSGGISSMDDIVRLDELGLHHVILGKAYYEGRVTLKDIERWSQNA